MRRSRTGAARPAGPAAGEILAHWGRTARVQAEHYLHQFIDGDHYWGQMRQTVVVVVVLLFILIGRLFEPITALPLLDRALELAGLNDVLPPAVRNLVAFFASFFTRQTLRHALPPVLGVALALYFGAAYLRDLLELPNLQLAFKYLTATLFGHDYPHMTISEGQAAVDDPETNPMLKIGGPGWVHTKIGNAAIFERLDRPSAVLGAGTHFIRRFETLREAFDLREIERSRNDIRVMTKDGLPVVLNEMRVRFRIRARHARTEANPYPMMVSAVQSAAYSRRVTARGLEDWADMVTGAVRGTVTDWIARRRMDELIPPPKDANLRLFEPVTGPSVRARPDGASTEPMRASASVAPVNYRQALHDLFDSARTHDKFARMGAEIIWVSVGHLRPDPDVDPDLQPGADATGRDKIHQQMIDTWKSTHAAFAQDEIIDARGYVHWLNESARIQAECDLILALTHNLAQARDSGLSLDDALVNRLVEFMTGERLRPPAGSERLTASLRLVQDFLGRANPAGGAEASAALPEGEEGPSDPPLTHYD